MIFDKSTPNGGKLSFENPLKSVISVKSLKFQKICSIYERYDFSMKDTEPYRLL